MKALLLFAVLLLSSNANADLKIEFNNQTFFLRTGFCMTIYKGKTHYCWGINAIAFSTAAEKKIAMQISERLALEKCSFLTMECKFYNQYCAD